VTSVEMLIHNAWQVRCWCTFLQHGDSAFLVLQCTDYSKHSIRCCFKSSPCHECSTSG